MIIGLLRAASAVIVAIAAVGGAARAQDATGDDSGRGQFPAGPLRQLDEALKSYGIRPSLTYIGEVLGNASGGIRRGAIYDGRLDLAIDADLEKLLGWSGAKFHANVFNTHGDGLSREYLGNLMTVSNIEALQSHAAL